MNDNLSDNEKFIIMILFGALLFIYLAFGIFDSPIHPLIKLLPFYALTIYVIIRNRLKKHKIE